MESIVFVNSIINEYDPSQNVKVFKNIKIYITSTRGYYWGEIITDYGFLLWGK